MDVIGTFVEFMTKAGPWAIAALLYYFWKLEREERLQAKAELKAVTEAAHVALTGVKDALRALRFTLLRGRSEPDDDIA